MINIKHILHPTDCGDNSDEALKYACSLATQFSANLHIVNVVQDVNVIMGPFGGLVPTDLNTRQVQIATEKLNELPGKIVNFGGEITRNVVEGVPFVQIIRYAQDNAIDLIVMGTHGFTGLEHLLIGSVAENVVRKAPCPVLTVHPEDYEFVMP